MSYFEEMSPFYSEAQLKEKIKGLNLLIVDDAAEMREALSSVFEGLGFRVFTAENGNAAFDLFKSIKFHGVLSDIRMPGGDGLELLENIRQQSPETPAVILMSGFSEITTEEAQRRGASSVIDKPFDKKKLVDIILKSIVDSIDASSAKKS